MQRKLFAAASAALLLGGCAQTAITLPPVVNYNATACDQTPNLASAVSLTPDKDKAVWELATPVDNASPCLAQEGGSTPYVVFSLPPEQTTKLVELGGAVEPIRIFSPSVSLLDGNGEITRTLNPDSYMFRNGMLSVQFVPADGEEFALVTANSAIVGQTHETLVASVNTTTIYTGFGASNWNSGAETSYSQGFSYEGVIRAMVYRADKD